MPPDPRRSFEILVVGAGPAGLAAAVSASGEGRLVGLVDDNPDLGGQIWRGERARPSGPVAGWWFRRAREAGDHDIAVMSSRGRCQSTRRTAIQPVLRHDAADCIF